MEERDSSLARVFREAHIIERHLGASLAKAVSTTQVYRGRVFRLLEQHAQRP